MIDWQPLMITIAPNGARKTQRDHKALPMTPEEIAHDAVLCRDAGATMFHLHVRDKNGGHTLDLDTYRHVIDEVRAAIGTDMIIQITTEAVGQYTPDEQISLVHALRPQAASVALKEIMSGDEEKASCFYHWAYKEGIALQHILYTPDDVIRLAHCIKRGLIPKEQLSVLYVIGRYDDGDSHPSDLLPFLNAARETQLPLKLWSVCAFGAGEGAVAMAAISLGGHVRVGFENNFYLNTGKLSPNNAALVDQTANGAILICRPLCNSRQAQNLLGIGGEKTGNGP